MNEPKIITLTETPFEPQFFELAHEIFDEEKYGKITVLLICRKTTLIFEREDGEIPLVIKCEGDYSDIEIDVACCKVCDYYERNLQTPKFKIIRGDCYLM